MKKHHSKRKGFTLIELLVVITIIGILAGIAIGAFGGIFGQAGQLAAKDKLMDIHKGIVQAYKGQAKFPTSESLEEQTPAGFAVWFRKKTRTTEPSLWFIDEDDRVLALTDDGGAGKPSLIPTDPGGLDDEQKSAIGWTIAIPGEGASTKLDQNLASGPFPIMWTRGHMVKNGKRTLLGVVMVDMFYFPTVKSSGTKKPLLKMGKACLQNHQQKMQMKIPILKR